MFYLWSYLVLGLRKSKVFLLPLVFSRVSSYDRQTSDEAKPFSPKCFVAQKYRVPKKTMVRFGLKETINQNWWSSKTRIFFDPKPNMVQRSLFFGLIVHSTDFCAAQGELDSFHDGEENCVSPRSRVVFDPRFLATFQVMVRSFF